MKAETKRITFFPFCKVLIVAVFLQVFFPLHAFSQIQRTLPVTANFKIEGGTFEGSYLVMENVSTGEKQTLKGISKFDLNLKFNSQYILSFFKPGYITKRIELNTSAPAERIEQGFYAVPMLVILFKQIEGVNIVVFNQPVGKYKFNALMDDFYYDTDYTKQIQSAIKEAEYELKQKQEEEKVKSVQVQKDKEKAKQDSIDNAKILMKEKQDSIAAAKILATARAEEERKAKADSVNAAKQLALVKAEEERKAKQIADEEARKQLKAKADEDARKQLTAKMDEEERKKLKEQQDADAKAAALKEKQDEEARRKLREKEAADEKARLAAKAKEDEEVKRKAKNISGGEIKPEPVKKETAEAETQPEEIETDIPANMSVETIEEKNRTITKATLTKGNHSTVYSKIIYKWGGVFYFKNENSISQSLFVLETGLK